MDVNSGSRPHRAHIAPNVLRLHRARSASSVRAPHRASRAMRSINAALRGYHSVAGSRVYNGPARSTQDSGPDPIHQAASTGVLGYSYPDPNP